MTTLAEETKEKTTDSVNIVKKLKRTNGKYCSLKKIPYQGSCFIYKGKRNQWKKPEGFEDIKFFLGECHVERRCYSVNDRYTRRKKKPECTQLEWNLPPSY